MENIRITSETGEVLHNSALIARVEDPQNFDDLDCETEDEEEDNESVQSSQDNNSSQRGHDEKDPNKVCEDVGNERSNPTGSRNCSRQNQMQKRLQMRRRSNRSNGLLCVGRQELQESQAGCSQTLVASLVHKCKIRIQTRNQPWNALLKKQGSLAVE